MKDARVSMHVVIKYTLLQIPGTVLLVIVLILVQKWAYIPPWLFWTIVAAWIAKEIVLFPFVWRSYDSSGNEAGREMLGRKGFVEEALNPSGYVRIYGELWNAKIREGREAIEKGDTVVVREINGLTLLVEREEEGSS